MDALSGTILYDKTLGSLLGGLIGDAIGTPTEGKHYREIEEQFGWVDDFACDGTDDTVMRDLLAAALIRTGGEAMLDDWAQVWLDNWYAIFGQKVGKFFISVLHTAHKMRRHVAPRLAALGNMPSSSSAMCISPVGVVNACQPRQAALQAYNLAALIHTHDVGFCQDGAAAIAAAVAEACHPGATITSILDAATAWLEKVSGAEMCDRIARALALADECRDYAGFRRTLYERAGDHFCRITCDARETVPLTLALLALGRGDIETCVVYAGNLGRDADTIGAMCGAIAGAWQGAAAVKPAWREKVRRLASRDQEALAETLCHAAVVKAARARAALDELDRTVTEAKGGSA